MSKRPGFRLLGVQRLFSGFFKLDAYEIELEKHEGGTMHVCRELLERGNSVGILVYDPRRDQVALANEFRIGIMAAGGDPFADGLPAGSIDGDEAVLEAARRELAEEMGLEAQELRVIHPGAYLSCGGTSERMTIVLALADLSRAGGVHGHAHEGEDIKTVIMSAADFIRASDEGAMVTMSACFAAGWLARHREALRRPFLETPGNDNAPEKGLDLYSK